VSFGSSIAYIIGVHAKMFAVIDSWLREFSSEIHPSIGQNIASLGT
jgi:hypothetical protein